MNNNAYYTIETKGFTGFSVYNSLEKATRANEDLRGKVSKVEGHPYEGEFEVIWTDDRPMADRPRNARFEGSYTFPSVFGFPADFYA